MDLLTPAARRAAASLHCWDKLIAALREERFALKSVDADTSAHTQAIKHAMKQAIDQKWLLNEEMKEVPNHD